MKSSSAFYGDPDTGGGTEAPTNITAKTAADNSGGDDTGRFVSAIREKYPNHWVWKDSQQTKRLNDEIRMALSAKGTTPEQDALLRQESPEAPEEENDWAMRTAKDMQKANPQWVLWSDPRKRQEFIQGLRERQAGGREAQQQPQQEPQEQPFSSEKFWNNPEEVQRAAKAVRPKRF